MPQSALQIRESIERLRSSPPLLIGRDRELETLRACVDARRSLFVSGPSGVGKTALLLAMYAGWHPGNGGLHLLYCAESGTGRAIATHLLVNLFLERGRLESRYVQRRKAVTSLHTLRHFTATEHLADIKRMMHQNLPRDRSCLILDHLDHADPRVASLIEVWLESMPLILVARDSGSLGRCRWLLSSMERLVLEPLDRAAMRRVANTLPDAGRLEERHLRQAVGRARGNPARLSALLHAAVRPEYRSGDDILWNLLELDLCIQAIGLGSPARRSRGRT